MTTAEKVKSPWVGVAIAVLALATTYVERRYDGDDIRDEIVDSRHELAECHRALDAFELKARHSEARLIQADAEQRTATQAVLDRCLDGDADLRETQRNLAEAIEKLDDRLYRLKPSGNFGGTYLVVPPPPEPRQKRISADERVLYSAKPEPVF